VRFVLAALAVLLAVGTGAVALREKPASPDSLVNALGEDDLGKFAIVDMADAVERVAAASAESR
jgi:hypothetical protein